ncbi:hypothetical protein Ancab_007047 [Ancistrocladus abbreviatus]
MAALLHRRLPFYLHVTISIRNHGFTTTDPPHNIISSLCDLLRKGMSWDTLNRKYNGFDFDSSMVEKVLIELREPIDAKRALGFFHWVAHSKKLEHGIKPYCIAIHILSRARLINDARALLESILLKNVGKMVDDDNSSLRFPIVDSLLSTYKITNSVPFVFDLLVQSYSRLRKPEIAFDVCCYLEEHGFSISLISFNTMLHVIQKSSDTNGVIWKVYEHMIKKRIYPNEVTIRIMVSALCKEGQLQKVVNILDRLHGKRCSPAVIVNTSMVFRMLDEGKFVEGMVLLKRMLQKNIILDTISFSLIVCAKVWNGELDSAQEVYQEMLKRGFHPNSFVVTVFIGAYCNKGMVEVAGKLVEQMTSIGLKPYDETYNLLIAGCARMGNLELGMRFCDEMMKTGLVPTCSAFNLMVERLCEAGNVKQANRLLTLLIEKGFSPDEVTYSHLIEGYRKEGNVQESLKLYYEMEHRSLSQSSHHSSKSYVIVGKWKKWTSL